MQEKLFKSVCPNGFILKSGYTIPSEGIVLRFQGLTTSI
jgi:hypothetical protein